MGRENRTITCMEIGGLHVGGEGETCVQEEKEEQVQEQRLRDVGNARMTDQGGE